MKHHIVTLGLAPFLVAQGLYVRQKTPRLPEPVGPRQGKQGTGPALKLLILGDSSAAGVGAPSQQLALSGQLVEILSASYNVSWMLEAKTGYTAKDLIDLLYDMPQSPFDIVIVVVGVNDVIKGTSQTQWQKQLDQLIQLSIEKFGSPRLFFSGLPPMHLFSALPFPLKWYLGKRARYLDDILSKHLYHYSNCQFLPINMPFEPAYLATDGFHPSPNAYTVWAEALAIEIVKEAL
ncbi:SGNH/GDSL hydrolase family protein [Zooshikella ganghwensis]|uniref:SGNH/GDSL hydrolase family protein n=1 Tax=Zooshikella ganghwensis TaxID=202772 RepID=UPI0004898577|nr:SGNH/GDSL hydrolase family protein [Zooshikella ganghwensis]